MHQFFYCFFLLWIPYFGFAQSPFERCSAEAFLMDHLRENPHHFKAWLQNEKRMQDWKDRSFPRQIIRIPVVVHVVWHQPEENISDEQIRSQFAVLNADFRALNCEFPNIPAEFLPVAADIGMEFCLVSVDPDGQPVSGITRTPTFLPKFDLQSKHIFHTERGGKDAWDTRRYLNIWITNLDGTLGFATFPGAVVDPSEDGVVIDYRYFGTIGTVNRPYHLGRTATHEIGHYFNLLHVFGDDGALDCEVDDAVEDTPLQGPSYQGQCPSYPQYSCGTSDMFMNFLDYTDDACMAMFSHGQKVRMLAALYTFRPGLLNQPVCEPDGSIRQGFSFQILPNPASSIVFFKPEQDHFPFVNLRIFGSTGILIFEQPDFPTASGFDIGQLSSGLYSAELRCPGYRWIGKFIVR